MPVYEYSCPECVLKFELLRPISQANEDASCPRCNNGAKRVLSNFAVFSKNFNGTLSRVGGDSACSTCSDADCSSCH